MQEKKRRETEIRLTEKLNRDKEELLERARREKEEEAKKIQMRRRENEKMIADRAAEYEVRYKETISNYLVTKETPLIMYKPAELRPVHKALLDERRACIESSSVADTSKVDKNDVENPDEHMHSVDMQLDEEEWLLSRVPEIICDRQPNSEGEQQDKAGEDH